MSESQRVSLTLMRAMALVLGQPEDYFAASLGFGAEPHIRMKILRYPDESEVLGAGGQRGYGVGPHKDYGFLAILIQDSVGVMQLRHDGQYLIHYQEVSRCSWPTAHGCAGIHVSMQCLSQWPHQIDATPIPGTMVVNVGEMFEAATQGSSYSSTTLRRQLRLAGLFKATTHRVLTNTSGLPCSCRHVTALTAHRAHALLHPVLLQPRPGRDHQAHRHPGRAARAVPLQAASQYRCDHAATCFVFRHRCWMQKSWALKSRTTPYSMCTAATPSRASHARTRT